MIQQQILPTCFMPMEQKNMCDQIKKPEIIVFAGPNGSRKTTVTKLTKVIEPYINADEINFIEKMIRPMD